MDPEQQAKELADVRREARFEALREALNLVIRLSSYTGPEPTLTEKELRKMIQKTVEKRDARMSDDTAPRVWHHSGPEDRLSIATNRFLHRSLVPPFWACAMPDSDHGTRSDLQRIRDAAKGQRPGVLDWVVAQGPHGLIRMLELKRGKNKPTEHQRKTIADLTECNAKPVIAWTLAEVHLGLTMCGFRFLPNWKTTLTHMEAQLEAWDRTAAGVKDGTIVKKRRPAKAHVRKAPGLTWLLP